MSKNWWEKKKSKNGSYGARRDKNGFYEDATNGINFEHQGRKKSTLRREARELAEFKAEMREEETRKKNCALKRISNNKEDVELLINNQPHMPVGEIRTEKHTSNINDFELPNVEKKQPDIHISPLIPAEAMYLIPQDLSTLPKTPALIDLATKRIDYPFKPEKGHYLSYTEARGFCQFPIVKLPTPMIDDTPLEFYGPNFNRMVDMKRKEDDIKNTIRRYGHAELEIDPELERQASHMPYDYDDHGDGPVNFTGINLVRGKFNKAKQHLDFMEYLNYQKHKQIDGDKIIWKDKNENNN